MLKEMRFVSLTTTMLIAFSFLLLSGCVQTSQQKMIDSGAKQLNGMELEELLTDSVRTWKNADGSTGTTTFRADGTAKSEWKGGSDEGTWRIKDNQVCTTWKKVRAGIEKCFPAPYKTGDNEYTNFKTDGTIASTASFSKL